MDRSLKILIVDDEEIIVDIMTQMLQRLGYHTEGYTRGQSALEAFRQSPKDYDLVITDLTMPDITGDRLAEDIKAVRNDIPILLYTGSSEKLNGEKLSLSAFQAVINKPADMRQLDKTIKSALERRQSDRRKDTRYSLRASAVAVSKNNPRKQVEITDISRSGFSFHYTEDTKLPGQFEQLSIRTLNESLSLDGIAYETISDITSEQGSETRPPVIRRRSGRFSGLTPFQNEQLALFIEKVAARHRNQRRCSL